MRRVLLHLNLQAKKLWWLTAWQLILFNVDWLHICTRRGIKWETYAIIIMSVMTGRSTITKVWNSFLAIKKNTIQAITKKNGKLRAKRASYHRKINNLSYFSHCYCIVICYIFNILNNRITPESNSQISAAAWNWAQIFLLFCTAHSSAGKYCFA